MSDRDQLDEGPLGTLGNIAGNAAKQGLNKLASKVSSHAGGKVELRNGTNALMKSYQRWLAVSKQPQTVESLRMWISQALDNGDPDGDNLAAFDHATKTKPQVKTPATPAAPVPATAPIGTPVPAQPAAQPQAQGAPAPAQAAAPAHSNADILDGIQANPSMRQIMQAVTQPQPDTKQIVQMTMQLLRSAKANAAATNGLSTAEMKTFLAGLLSSKQVKANTNLMNFLRQQTVESIERSVTLASTLLENAHRSKPALREALDRYIAEGVWHLAEATVLDRKTLDANMQFVASHLMQNGHMDAKGNLTLPPAPQQPQAQPQQARRQAQPQAQQAQPQAQQAQGQSQGQAQAQPSGQTYNPDEYTAPAPRQPGRFAYQPGSIWNRTKAVANGQRYVPKNNVVQSPNQSRASTPAGLSANRSKMQSAITKTGVTGPATNDLLSLADRNVAAADLQPIFKKIAAGTYGASGDAVMKALATAFAK